VLPCDDAEDCIESRSLDSGDASFGFFVHGWTQPHRRGGTGCESNPSWLPISMTTTPARLPLAAENHLQRLRPRVAAEFAVLLQPPNSGVTTDPPVYTVADEV